MNNWGRRLTGAATAVVGITALGAVSSGTAFAATMADRDAVVGAGGAGAASVDGMPDAGAASAQAAEPHSFEMPTMPTSRGRDTHRAHHKGSHSSQHRHHQQRHHQRRR